MSYLVFCSYEIGALPFVKARTLNQHGVRTYYLSLSGKASGHNSTEFHFGSEHEDWNLSHRFRDLSYLPHKIDQVLYWPRAVINRLKTIKEQYAITHCFATGIKSYLLKEAGIPYKYWSYGSDLDRHCFHPVFPPGYPSWIGHLMDIPFRTVIRPNARKTICHSDSVMIAPYQAEKLRQVCDDKKLFFLPHLIEVMDYEVLARQKIESKRKVCKEIGTKHFFFSSSRHEWAGKYREEPDLKGNDIILKAFGKYLSKTKNNDAKLILVEKGTDIEASKSLAKELNISEYIFWIKQMKRHEIQKFYQGATMCFGQFGNPVVTYVALEPLANGNVCASFYGDNSSKVPFYDEMPPIFNSKDPDEIADFMQEVIDNNDFYNDLCYKSWKWTAEHCSGETFVRSFVEVFNEC
jgi:glycosyltransferase involved in cell wall biosynthesis